MHKVSWVDVALGAVLGLTIGHWVGAKNFDATFAALIVICASVIAGRYQLTATQKKIEHENDLEAKQIFRDHGAEVFSFVSDSALNYEGIPDPNSPLVNVMPETLFYECLHINAFDTVREFAEPDARAHVSKAKDKIVAWEQLSRKHGVFAPYEPYGNIFNFFVDACHKEEKALQHNTSS